jgi:hypothetical protein
MKHWILVATLAAGGALVLGACGPDQSRGKITGIIAAPEVCANGTVTVNLKLDQGGAVEDTENVTLSLAGGGTFLLQPSSLTSSARFKDYRVSVDDTTITCSDGNDYATVDSPSPVYRLHWNDSDTQQHNFTFQAP